SSASSPVIGRLCAFPELQFWRPITSEKAEPSSRANIQWTNRMKEQPRFLDRIVVGPEPVRGIVPHNWYYWEE
ncbi:unnamed protein product, partial [Staurois parvus]